MGTTVQDYSPQRADNIVISEYLLKEKSKLITTIKKRGLSIHYELAARKETEECNNTGVFDDEYGITEIASKQKHTHNMVLNERKDGVILLLQQVDKEDYQVIDIEDYNNHFNNVNSIYAVYFIDEEDRLLPLSIGTVFIFKYDETIKLEVSKLLKPRGITKFYKYQVTKH